MSITNRRICVALAALLLASRTAVALAPEDFASGWPLELPADTGVFDVALTHEIYSEARALEQIAVLDRDGEPMPFYRAGEQPGSSRERRVTLGASPLYATSAAGGADIRVAADEDGARVTLTRPPGVEDAEIVGFVIDARDVGDAPAAIELDWRELDRPFLIGVTIEHSSTLEGWRPVGRGSIASLSIDGVSTRHARIAIAGRSGGYYRVGVARSVPDWQLTAATLIVAEQTAAAPQVARLTPVEPAPVDALPGTVHFDAGGRLPVSGVTIDFPGRSGWAVASVAASDALEGPWRPIAPARLFYRIDFEGTTFTDTPVDVGRVEARYFRVSLDPDAPQRPLQLVLEYPTEYLRFSADGAAPFMLVAGTLADGAGPDATFASVWSELERAGGAALPATAGARVELGGAAALEPPFVFPWRSALLVGVLTAAVLAVAWMALRLGRDLFRDA